MAPHVRILMATFQGATHLPAQLTSFEAQSHADWSLWASDDGSTDATLDLLRAFAAHHPGRVRLTDGPRKGSAANFLHLLGHPELSPGPVALSDQDDVWLPHRLARGLQLLSGDGTRPNVYASRTIRTDADLRPLSPSVRHPRPPSFRNALVQNILAGNTLMLDAPALALLRATIPATRAAGVRHHDWWVYLVAAGAGARIVNDDEPGLLYRQHGANLMGAHQGPGAALARLRTLRARAFADWITRNLAALQAVAPLLTPQARADLDAFARLRAARNPLARALSLHGAGLHRQSAMGQASLVGLAAMGWL